MSDSSDLQRFVDAPAAIYSVVEGCKRKDHSRYPWLSRRHEIPVLHDAVRRRLEAVIFAEAVAAFYPARTVRL
jgi:uncharacterized protein (DUF1810 family)